MIEGLIKNKFENKERHKLVLTGGNANYFNDMFVIFTDWMIYIKRTKFFN